MSDILKHLTAEQTAPTEVKTASYFVGGFPVGKNYRGRIPMPLCDPDDHSREHPTMVKYGQPFHPQATALVELELARARKPWYEYWAERKQYDWVKKRFESWEESGK